MGDFDRKLYPTTRRHPEDYQAEGKVHGNIEIDKGDLVFLDRIGGLRNRGSSTADYYIYPFSKISGITLTLASNRQLAKENFLGVAAWHSDSGVTSEIAVHIRGLFQYPLKHNRHTKISYNVTPTGSGTTLYNQRCAVESGSSYSIGLVADSGKFRSSVNVLILSQFFSGVTKG